MPLTFYQALEASGSFLIIFSITIGVDLLLICRKMWLHNVDPLAFRINYV
jgi:hypothetical protein